MKAEEANKIVNQTTKDIKYSGLSVIAMSEALLCIAKNLSAIPIDCANNLIGHYYGETVAEAWMKAINFKENLEQAIQPIKFAGKVEDLFYGTLRHEEPKKQ